MTSAIPGRYHAFGLTLQCELPLPEVRAAIADVPVDATVRFGEAPQPDLPRSGDDTLIASRDTFWFQVDDIARFLVTDGRDILVERIGNASDGQIRAFLLGTAIGALLHQRGILPLHASAVLTGDKAVAFTGASGAGKSTIALHLSQRGHPLLCDDICAIDTSGPTPMIWPGLRNLKLWRASLLATGHEVVGLEPVLPTIDKYRLPIDTLASYRPYPLAAVIQLERGTALSLKPLAGAAAAAALISNTFRGQLVGPMQRTADHFAQCLAVARTAEVLQLVRSWSLDELDASSLLVEAHC